jgi:ribonuclease P protein component
VSGVSRAKFPKSAHLLKHADFRRVYENGKRHFSGNLTAFYLGQPEEMKAAPVRIGFTVSRALGGSVDRNRIRRRTREAVRSHMDQLAGIAEPVDIVFNPKKSVLKIDFSVLSEEVAKALQVVRKNMERTRTKSESGS